MPEQANLVQKKRAQLQQGVHDMGALVIEALRRSVDCLSSQDLALAGRIIEGDELINHRRRVLEQECLVTLAAFKPAGEDLRCIGACLSLVSELERIGDYAADVARIIRRAQGGSFPPEPVAAIAGIAETAIGMLSGALAAFDAGGDAAARPRRGRPGGAGGRPGGRGRPAGRADDARRPGLRRRSAPTSCGSSTTTSVPPTAPPMSPNG